MSVKRTASVVVLSLSFTFPFVGVSRAHAETAVGSTLAPGARVEKLADGFRFTEGPASDYEGNVYFSDVRQSRIHRWSVDGALSTFRENTGQANGLFFDATGNLIACAGGSRSVVSFAPDGEMTTVADRYLSHRLNQPNDLWVAPCGGIYFTDPVFGKISMEVDGENVYYITPDHKHVIKVIEGFEKPNGIVGNPMTGVLYVIDTRKDMTYAYSIGDDGMLSDGRVFAPEGYDGMTVDVEGNVYITTRQGISVYDSSGVRIETIEVPETTTNLCIGGRDHRTLFITAGSSLYSVRLKHQGFVPEMNAAIFDLE